MNKKRTKILVFILCLVIVYSIGLIGSLFIMDEVDSAWYQSVKPSITPPNFVFPIVWNILFFLIACSLYFSWTAAKKNQKRVVVWIYGTNFILNVLWSFFYFELHKVGYAFFDLFLLWLSILVLIEESWKIDRKATYFLVPYLIWISYAAILNYLSIR